MSSGTSRLLIINVVEPEGNEAEQVLAIFLNNTEWQAVASGPIPFLWSCTWVSSDLWHTLLLMWMQHIRKWWIYYNARILYSRRSLIHIDSFLARTRVRWIDKHAKLNSPIACRSARNSMHLPRDMNDGRGRVRERELVDLMHAWR